MKAPHLPHLLDKLKKLNPSIRSGWNILYLEGKLSKANSFSDSIQSDNYPNPLNPSHLSLAMPASSRHTNNSSKVKKSGY
jgi:hypothetical protein